VSHDKIVAIGFLTRRDLSILGEAFDRQIPVPDDDIFASLLDQLDRVEASPHGGDVVIRTTRFDTKT